jgi:pimeloyl-ACP methyl ester carboxylesterase
MGSPPGSRVPRVCLIALTLGALYLMVACPSGSAAPEAPLGDGRILLARHGDLWSLELPSHRLVRLTKTARWNERPGSWSPDGARIAFVRTPSAPSGQPVMFTPEVWVMDVAQGQARRLSTADGGDFPAWSPDGSRIAYGSPRGLILVRPDGTHRERLGIPGSCPVWSPDATRIAYCAALTSTSTASSVQVVGADGRDDHLVSDPGFADTTLGAWSPDGTSLAYAGKRAGGDFDVVRADLTGTTSERVQRRPGDQAVEAWTRSGAIVIADWPTATTRFPRWLAMRDAPSPEPIRLPTRTEESLAWHDARQPTLTPAIGPRALSAGERLVDIGGRKIFLSCEGSSTRVVLMDAPLGADSTTWRAAQRLLAPRDRVCRYDRAGLGLSDPASGPRDAAAAVDDLHRVVARARLGTPFVLVGASFGGLVAQLYADRYPQQVSGLVLVDALHPDLDRRIEALLSRRQRADRRRALAQNLEGIRYADLLRSDVQVREAERHLSMPVAVLRHGLPFANSDGVPARAVERLWGELQRSLATLGSPSRTWIARRSHHRIAEMQPRVVAEAVGWIERHAAR